MGAEDQVTAILVWNPKSPTPLIATWLYKFHLATTPCSRPCTCYTLLNRGTVLSDAYIGPFSPCSDSPQGIFTVSSPLWVWFVVEYHFVTNHCSPLDCLRVQPSRVCCTTCTSRAPALLSQCYIGRLPPIPYLLHGSSHYPNCMFKLYTTLPTCSCSQVNSTFLIQKPGFP